MVLKLQEATESTCKLIKAQKADPHSPSQLLIQEVCLRAKQCAFPKNSQVLLTLLA